MPTAPAKPCAEPGCPALVARGRCPAHARVLWRRLYSQPMTTTARGYGHTWRQRRSAVLARDGHLCQVCRREQATQVDHVIAKANNGTDDESNLQAICAECHALKSAKEGAARECPVAGSLPLPPRMASPPMTGEGGIQNSEGVPR